MDYIISNITNKGEIRISNHEIEGRLIYNGHKLAIPDEILSYIIYYTHEKYNNSYHFLNYKKWKEIYNLERINPLMTECWFMESNTRKALLNSYDTLLDILKDSMGDFKKIYIVEI